MDSSGFINRGKKQCPNFFKKILLRVAENGALVAKHKISDLLISINIFKFLVSSVKFSSLRYGCREHENIFRTWTSMSGSISIQDISVTESDEVHAYLRKSNT